MRAGLIAYNRLNLLRWSAVPPFQEGFVALDVVAVFATQDEPCFGAYVEGVTDFLPVEPLAVVDAGFLEQRMPWLRVASGWSPGRGPLLTGPITESGQKAVLWHDPGTARMCGSGAAGLGAALRAGMREAASRSDRASHGRPGAVGPETHMTGAAAAIGA